MDTQDTSQLGAGLSGRLLIAMPGIDTGPFAKSVVLIARHDRHHAMGIILNKPIKGMTAQDAVMEIRLTPAMTGENAPVFFGGPCDVPRGFVLHSLEYRSDRTLIIGDDFGITSTRKALERLYGDQQIPYSSRLMVGYAGWSPGQLDEELRRNMWLDVPASPAFVFTIDPKHQWEAAMDQMGLSESQLAAMIADIDAGSRPLN